MEIDMKFLFASDSFKGTLSSRQTARLLTQAAREIFPDCECDSIEVADGGEGTTDAVVAATGGGRVEVNVHGPLWEEWTAVYGKLDEKRAVMEMGQLPDFLLCPRNSGIRERPRVTGQER